MLVTFLPWPWGLFTEHCLLAMQEPDLGAPWDIEIQ